MKFPKTKKKKTLPPLCGGFTLVELVVVIAIIGILAAVLVPSYISYVERSRAAVCSAERKELVHAYELALIGSAASDSPAATVSAATTLLTSVAEGAGLSVSSNKLSGLCPSGKLVSETVNSDLSVTLICPRHGITTTSGDSDFSLSLGLIDRLIESNFKEDKMSHYDGMQLIKDYYTANGNTLNQVDTVLVKSVLGDSFSSELYWRPSRANLIDEGNNSYPGYVMYASAGNNSGHSSWIANLLVYDGIVYKPVSGTEASVAFSNDNRTKEQMLAWLDEKGWKSTGIAYNPN